MSFKKAMALNFLTAVACLGGFYIGIPIAQDEGTRQWIFAVAAGMFLYIALADMVLFNIYFSILNNGNVKLIDQKWLLYTRVTLKLLTLPPPPEEREKNQLLKGTSTSPSHHHQLPFESKLPFPACFPSILGTGEYSRWIDDWVKVGEEIVESRWCTEKILEGTSGIALHRRRTKWLIFLLFLPVPFTVSPSNEVMIATTQVKSILDFG